MTEIIVGITLMLLIAGLVHRWPRLGPVLFGGYALIVGGFFIYALLSGELMRPAAGSEAEVMNCTDLRTC